MKQDESRRNGLKKLGGSQCQFVRFFDHVTSSGDYNGSPDLLCSKDLSALHDSDRLIAPFERFRFDLCLSKVSAKLLAAGLT
jgi:hypothetical protein